jgi:hypothetical protein
MYTIVYSGSERERGIYPRQTFFLRGGGLQLFNKSIFGGFEMSARLLSPHEFTPVMEVYILNLSVIKS